MPPQRQPRDPEITSRMMAAVKSKDTRPELVLRRELHRRGLRYRLQAKDLPGTPDIVFRPLRIAIFVDGDFWHGNAHRVRGLARLADLFPTRTDWWVAKIEGNVARDLNSNLALREAGWMVIRVWESDVLADVGRVANQIEVAVRAGDNSRDRAVSPRKADPA